MPGIDVALLPDPRECHLGDRWARLNFALRLLEQGEQFTIHLPDPPAKTIVDLLDIGQLRPEIVPSRPADMKPSRPLIRRIDTRGLAYRCRYFPTKIRHRPARDAIGYAFSANWQAEQKVPPNADEVLARLKAALPKINFVPMGRPHQPGIVELVEALSRVRLLLAVDNGVAHVARSAGTPLFLIEHGWPVCRGFPPEACSYRKVTAKTTVPVIVQYLRESESAWRAASGPARFHGPAHRPTGRAAIYPPK